MASPDAKVKAEMKYGVAPSFPPRCYRHRIEYGEEASLVPSHLFYLSGCNLRCRFCIGAPQAFDPAAGEPLTAAFFRNAVAWGQRQEPRPRTLQWVGGEPTIHANALIALMKTMPNLPPVVLKSNFYTTAATLDQFCPYVATFVADFKFGQHCAASLCGAADYWDVVTAALSAVYTMVSPVPERLIIRHLLLPGHLACCFEPVLAWCRRHVPLATFSLRDGYTPAGDAKSDPKLRHWLSAEEANLARTILRR